MKRSRLRSPSGSGWTFGVAVWLALVVSACGTSADPDGDSQAKSPAGGSSSGGSSSEPGGSASGGKSAPSGGSGTNGGSSSGQGSAGKAAGGGGAPVVSTFPDAQAYVDAHNQVRAAVQKPASYSGNWEPLPDVRWSDEVAGTAQEWANHLRDSMNCDLEHAQASGYGENLAGGGGLGAKQAVELWASELANYTYAAKYQFMSNTGHYTQIVWRKSTSIGCGKAECGRSAVVVCRYDPPGNVIGGSIF